MLLYLPEARLFYSSLLYSTSTTLRNQQIAGASTLCESEDGLTQ